MTEPSRGEMLPIPLYADGWPRDKRLYAEALWDFHRSLVHAHAPSLDGADLAAYFESERKRALAAEPLQSVPDEITSKVYEAVDRFALPGELLGRQIIAAQSFKEAIRFEDSRASAAFIEKWAQSHGRILAHLADVRGAWQLTHVDEFASAFFWVGRLMTLKDDLARDWLFFPLSDLRLAEVSVEDLQSGEITEGVRRLLWKQTIRAKDAFAQSEQLVIDLPRPYASAVKRWWIGGLEILNEIVRRDYDVWTEPVTLSTFYRLQVRLQAKFGRTTFRSR